MPISKHRPIRSLFFAPANRADLITKLPRSPADCFVIDLEDGTPLSEKEVAREALAGNVAVLRAAGVHGLVTVRVNSPESEHYLSDLHAAWTSGADGVVIPKLEQVNDLSLAIDTARVAGRVEGDATHGIVIAGIESVAGVANSRSLCAFHPIVSAVYFGAEDFISEMGGRRTSGGAEVLYARSQVVLAAKHAGIHAIDQAVVDIRDEERFRADSERGRDLGYDGKICLLPRQVVLANELFSPDAAEVDFSRRLIAAYEIAIAKGIGTIDFEGRMIDAPLLKRARQVLAVVAAMNFQKAS
jgi:citrate lyase subunit beta/citryl-CoA lyase